MNNRRYGIWERWREGIAYFALAWLCASPILVGFLLYVCGRHTRELAALESRMDTLAANIRIVNAYGDKAGDFRKQIDDRFMNVRLAIQTSNETTMKNFNNLAHTFNENAKMERDMIAEIRSAVVRHERALEILGTAFVPKGGGTSTVTTSKIPPAPSPSGDRDRCQTSRVHESARCDREQTVPCSLAARFAWRRQSRRIAFRDEKNRAVPLLGAQPNHHPVEQHGHFSSLSVTSLPDEGFHPVRRSTPALKVSWGIAGRPPSRIGLKAVDSSANRSGRQAHCHIEAPGCRLGPQSRKRNFSATVRPSCSQNNQDDNQPPRWTHRSDPQATKRRDIQIPAQPTQALAPASGARSRTHWPAIRYLRMAYDPSGLGETRLAGWSASGQAE